MDKISIIRKLGFDCIHGNIKSTNVQKNRVPYVLIKWSITKFNTFQHNCVSLSGLVADHVAVVKNFLITCTKVKYGRNLVQISHVVRSNISNMNSKQINLNRTQSRYIFIIISGKKCYSNLYVWKINEIYWKW